MARLRCAELSPRAGATLLVLLSFGCRSQANDADCDCGDPNWAAWPMPNAAVEVASGAPHLQSYADLHDGTVFDNVTQLMWQQATTAEHSTQPAALAYCSHLVLGGHADWRLPAVIELVSIVDTGHYDPSIDAELFPGTPAIGFYWSSTTYAGMAGNLWGVYFNNGYEAYNDASLPYSARCVRAGSAGKLEPTASRYALENGMVYDLNTELSWQQAISSSVYTQPDAVSYCAQLAANGTPWRLPTMRELLTIADLSVPPPGPAIDGSVFPDTPAGFFWSSTPYSGTPSQFWSAQFQYGFAYGNEGTDTSFARCVATGRARH